MLHKMQAVPAQFYVREFAGSIPGHWNLQLLSVTGERLNTKYWLTA